MSRKYISHIMVRADTFRVDPLDCTDNHSTARHLSALHTNFETQTSFDDFLYLPGVLQRFVLELTFVFFLMDIETCVIQ